MTTFWAILAIGLMVLNWVQRNELKLARARAVVWRMRAERVIVERSPEVEARRVVACEARLRLERADHEVTKAQLQALRDSLATRVRDQIREGEWQ